MLMIDISAPVSNRALTLIVSPLYLRVTGLRGLCCSPTVSMAIPPVDPNAPLLRGASLAGGMLAARWGSGISCAMRVSFGINTGGNIAETIICISPV